MAFLVSLALKIQSGACFQAFSAWVFSSLCGVFLLFNGARTEFVALSTLAIDRPKLGMLV